MLQWAEQQQQQHWGNKSLLIWHDKESKNPIFQHFEEKKTQNLKNIFLTINYQEKKKMGRETLRNFGHAACFWTRARNIHTIKL
jgi:hypothetical protein